MKQDRLVIICRELEVAPGFLIFGSLAFIEDELSALSHCPPTRDHERIERQLRIPDLTVFSPIVPAPTSDAVFQTTLKRKEAAAILICDEVPLLILEGE